MLGRSQFSQRRSIENSKYNRPPYIHSPILSDTKHDLHRHMDLWTGRHEHRCHPGSLLGHAIARCLRRIPPLQTTIVIQLHDRPHTHGFRRRTFES